VGDGRASFVVNSHRPALSLFHIRSSSPTRIRSHPVEVPRPNGPVVSALNLTHVVGGVAGFETKWVGLVSEEDVTDPILRQGVVVMLWCRVGTSVPPRLARLRGVGVVLVMGGLIGLGEGTISTLDAAAVVAQDAGAIAVKEQTGRADRETLPTSAARPGHLGGGRDRLDSPVEWIAIGSLCLAVVAGAYVAIRAARDSSEEDEEDMPEDRPGIAETEHR